jgi:aminoglycoside/choline kinase family phosphotransferase
VAHAGWGAAQAEALAGDASSRRYMRLHHPDGRRAVLMIAPPAPDDSTARFCAVADHLAGLGFAAPALLARAPDEGLLLLEDLGDAVFAGVIERDAATERPLYAAAIDFLADLHRHKPPAFLPVPDADTLAAMTAPAADWYLGHGAPHPHLSADFARALAPALADAMTGPLVLAHRDFHAENLIWLPDRAGAARVGLLDFQDAFAGPPAYDLVSLLEDARRDLAPGLRSEMVARYAATTGMAEPMLEKSLAVLGAQRNLRILGVFARLCLHMGKARYVDLIPRVWGHLIKDLAHSDLADLRRLVTETLPEPTDKTLQDLRSRCQMIPMP